MKSTTTPRGASRPRKPRAVIGVDVQQSRGCPYVVLAPGRPGATLRCEATGWLEGDQPAPLGEALAAAIGRHGVVAAGIDAPRCPLPAPRRWRFGGGRWRVSPRGMTGRHAEVVISSTRTAHPQWTPLAADAPGWMRNGFALFAAATELLGDRVYEVFPTAAYRLLAGDDSLRLELSAGDLRRGPKDVLDAAMAAATVVEYRAGRGQAAGGGDGLGAIVLPRRIPNAPAELMAWPGPPGE